MPPEIETSAERARTAPAEELKSLLHASRRSSSKVILVSSSCGFSSKASSTSSLDLPANVVSAVAAQPKWISSEGVRLRLAAHPRTPKRIALAVSKQLYLFDLVRLSLLPSAPADIKRIAEEIIVARLPQLPVGQKLTLARRGSARVAGAILAEGHAQAIKIALNNAFLNESQVLKVLAKGDVRENVVASIAQHPKWSCQYSVRMALVRNPHTPIPCLLAFLSQLNRSDLLEIARTQSLAPHLRKYLERELAGALDEEPADARENGPGREPGETR